ncbi:hypothetical protein HI914_07327 [Erysiphe necator]|nr:hypothetical protein HI914_07327 [Erysiphe necator]
MSDQNVVGTPSSNVDLSVNGNPKSHTPKDKACPFCHQQFTSSSLGRHLDLYIKEKNPKPADGLHNIEEIRKMRGSITRRQPRNSTNKREHSMDTPDIRERKSPRPDVDREKNSSPTTRRYNPKEQSHTDHRGNVVKVCTYKNGTTWESPGILNNNSVQYGSDARSWDDEDRDPSRRPVTRSRSVSRKIIAKTSFEQKQKMIDALDSAKAAELALRELAGSVRAAKQKIQTSPILDFDPLTMDFPALCLHCLLPPPTLNTSTPIPSPTSWSLSPPDNSQYQAIRNHFTSLFHNYRMSFSFTSAVPKQEISFPTQNQLPTSADNKDVASSSINAANKLELKVNEHIQAIYRAWQALPSSNQSEIWTLSLARSIAMKSYQIESLKREVERLVQEAVHLRQEVSESGRMQYPREFRSVPPRTTHVEGELISVLGEQMYVMDDESRVQLEKNETKSRSSNQINENNILDGNVHLDTAVERVISRWRNVVKDVRMQLGRTSECTNPDKSIGAQQSLTGDNVGVRERARTQNADVPNEWGRAKQIAKNNSGTAGAGSDADADADMEEEDTSSFVEMVDAPPIMHPQTYNQQLLHQNQNHHNHHQPQPQLRNHGFRISSGNGNENTNNLNTENPCANGSRYTPDGN